MPSRRFVGEETRSAVDDELVGRDPFPPPFQIRNLTYIGLEKKDERLDCLRNL